MLLKYQGGACNLYSGGLGKASWKKWSQSERRAGVGAKLRTRLGRQSDRSRKAQAKTRQ